MSSVPSASPGDVGRLVENSLLGTLEADEHPSEGEAPYSHLEADSAHTHDALTKDGHRVNIKATKPWVVARRNDDGGVDRRERGRFRIWRDDYEACEYLLLALYDPDRYDPIFKTEMVAIDDPRLVEGLPQMPSQWWSAGPDDTRDDRYYRLVWSAVWSDAEVEAARRQ